MEKLAIITTHPIQYYAPVFKHLTNNGIACKVFYTWGKGGLQGKYDPNFGKTIEWDIPLLDGYEYEFCENTATKPGSHHFKGIINPKLIASIQAYKATHLLVFGWNFQSHLKVLRHFKGKIPILFRGDSTLLDTTSFPKKILRKLLLTWIYKHVDIALYVGEANKQYYQYCGLTEQQLVFAPHAIDNQRFATTNAQQAAFIQATHAQFNIASTDRVIVFCGKFQPKKNPLLLVQAFQQVAKQNHHLILVGNGVLEEQLKLAAKENSNIHFLPFQNQSFMPAVYRLGQIFCLPSQGPGETWGLAVNEAMACARVVLVSNKCGCADNLVHNGENGFVFESGNSQNLRQRLNQLLNCDDSTLIKMGNDSYRMIQDWSFDAIVESVKERMGRWKV
ncbi:MAG: glycosyltransferase family 4 protein [Chitinophagaceae bacterium]